MNQITPEKPLAFSDRGDTMNIEAFKSLGHLKQFTTGEFICTEKEEGDTAYLLLVHKKTYAGLLAIFNIKLCRKRGIRAYAVIMAVARNHASVDSEISCCSGRYNLK